MITLTLSCITVHISSRSTTSPLPSLSLSLCPVVSLTDADEPNIPKEEPRDPSTSLLPINADPVTLPNIVTNPPTAISTVFNSIFSAVPPLEGGMISFRPEDESF